MELVMLLVGRSIPRSAAVTGGIFKRLYVMRTYPKRNSLTSAGENKCVSLALKKRPLTGKSYGKFKSAALILLARVPPREACKPPAPNGREDSALEKKNRAETLSCPPRNSRS